MRTGRRTWRIGLAVLLDALHGMVIADAGALINTHSKQTHTEREN
jgi:hypothetical protein